MGAWWNAGKAHVMRRGHGARWSPHLAPLAPRPTIPAHLCPRSLYASMQRSTRCSLMTASSSSSPQMGRPSGYSLPAGHG